MKGKTVFSCQQCGSISYKWQGRCHDCGSWNSFIEETVQKEPKEGRSQYHNSIMNNENKLASLVSIPTSEKGRTLTNINEFDQVLGGGLLPGMFVLIGGDPGIGKSTIVLQVCNSLASQNKRVIYVTGEESPTQIKIRAQRLSAVKENILILSEINFEKIILNIEKEKPDLIVVDSIQTIATSELTGTPGSVSQIREVAARFMMYAKNKNVPIIIVGHVTKDGLIAGPKVLEHMVDTVLYFEGENSKQYRILRAVKNRFGSTNEIGVFEMTQEGLKQIEHPSDIFINSADDFKPGSVIISSIEGTRSLLVELQSLVSRSNYGMAKRTSLGIDPNRVSMLLAVMEKHLNISISGYDVFMNVAGGLKIVDTAMDLGIIMSVISSYENRPLSHKHLFMGEVGLSGEIRRIHNVENRIKEASRMGFEKIVLPHSSDIAFMKKYQNLEFIRVKSVNELLEI